MVMGLYGVEYVYAAMGCQDMLLNLDSQPMRFHTDRKKGNVALCLRQIVSHGFLDERQIVNALKDIVNRSKLPCSRVSGKVTFLWLQRSLRKSSISGSPWST
jgi:hypothetical protein